jgi:pimeloyl-ACP methyl ester carboxylesterase
VFVGGTLLLTAHPAPASAAPAGPGSAARSATPASGIRWAPCEEDATAECGTLTVPVDWAKPRGDTFDLAVARRRADGSSRVGALLINPGGPGGSGVDFALGAASYFSPEIMRKFDVVGFDPRGVARSHPVVCSEKLFEQAPTSLLTSRADYERLVAFNRTLGQDCRKRTGPLFDHVDTLAVIQDMDAIRVALGERRINYYGISYGTLIGQQYAERYPKNFRALVIDSNMDHSLGSRRFFETETATGEENFGEFVRWCARDTACPFHRTGAGTVWDALVARADRGELRDPNSDMLLTAFDLSSNALGAFYGPDWAALAAWLESLRTGLPVAGGPAPVSAAAPRHGAARDDVVEYPVAVFCEDWRIQVRSYREAAKLWADARRIAPHMRMSPIAWSVGSACPGFTTTVHNPPHPLKVKGAAPILMLNARYDPATGYNWAVNAAKQLGKAATLVTYEGWGHGVYGRGPCANRITDRYLVDLTMPARGTRCPAIPPAPAPGKARSPVAPAVPGGPLPWGAGS